MASPKTIAILPDAAEDRRIRVTLAQNGKGLQLVHETFSEGVGWFSQGQIELSPEQVSDLRDALGLTEARRSVRPRAMTAPLTVYRAG
jgi:hypothetical protein